jgi:hypothetical protein
MIFERSCVVGRLTRWVSCGRWMIGFSIAALWGCSSEESEETSMSRQKTSLLTPAPQAVQVLIRRTVEGYEIEVQSPQAMPPGDISPSLRVGDHEFARSRESSTVGFHGIVFLLSDAEFAALQDGSPISLGLGATSHPGLTFHGTVVGTLNKSAVGN